MAAPNRTYLSNGQVLENAPFSARVSRSIDNIYNFFGLYFVSLFSGRRNLSIQYTQPTKLIPSTSTMGIFKYAGRIRVGGEWFFRRGRTKKTDGDGGRREGAGMQQLRVKVEIWQEQDVVVTVANEGSDNVLIDGLVIPVDHLMEILGTPHVRGTAFLYQRQVQHSDQDIFDNAAVNNNHPPYATAINDPPPTFELVLQPDPYFQREREQYLLNNMNRLELDNMLVLAQTCQGICNFSSDGLSAREIREHVIRDFYEPRRQ